MKKPIVDNLGLKVSAVLIALVLWFFVTSRGQSEISLDVPVEFKNMPQGLEMVNSTSKTVAVTVRGQERMMKNLRPADIRVFVDLEKAKKGEGTFYIATNDIRLPYSLAVVSVNPTSVKARLDETANRVVSVRPVITGEPEPGFRVVSVDLDPKNITISGLKTEIKKIRELKTEPVDITGLNRILMEEIGIDLSRANIKVDRERVQITITVSGGRK